jgi:hypothetical protein
VDKNTLPAADNAGCVAKSNEHLLNVTHVEVFYQSRGVSGSFLRGAKYSDFSTTAVVMVPLKWLSFVKLQNCIQSLEVQAQVSRDSSVKPGYSHIKDENDDDDDDDADDNNTDKT